MHEQKLDKKFQNDAAEVKKDINTLMDDGVSRVAVGFEKLSSEAKSTLVGAADSVKKNVGQGLSQYNSKAQEYANKVPGGWAEKAVKYPWVAITVGLGVGLILGGLFKPARKF